jgi:hypothetical protein
LEQGQIEVGVGADDARRVGLLGLEVRVEDEGEFALGDVGVGEEPTVGVDAEGGGVALSAGGALTSMRAVAASPIRAICTRVSGSSAASQSVITVNKTASVPSRRIVDVTNFLLFL